MDRSLFLARLRHARQAGHLTASDAEVARELLRYAGRHGECWPALATIAAGIGCSVRTVSRAIVRLRLVGLLSWRQRKARWNRCASNVYAMLVPALIQPRIPLSRSLGKMSNGSQPMLVGRALLAALTSAGRTMGFSTAEVMPWLDLSLLEASSG